MHLKLGERQFTTIRLDGLERLQAEGSFQQAPKWACADSTIVATRPSEDGLSCRVEAVRPGTTAVSVTDRDDARVPAVIFPITVTADRITNLGVTIEPAQGAGIERSPERSHTPLPEGAVQHDPNTQEIRHETDADTGDRPDTSDSGVGPTDTFEKPSQEDAQGRKPEQPAPPAQPEQPVS
jgi:hypothetical protein